MVFAFCTRRKGFLRNLFHHFGLPAKRTYKIDILFKMIILSILIIFAVS